MYISVEQKKVLKELKESVEKATVVFSHWKIQLTVAQKYDDASECNGFVNELNSILNAISKQ